MSDNNESTITTTTALMSRIPIFEPTRKPSYAADITHDENGNELDLKLTRVVDNTARLVKSKYGEAVIFGRLGQAHANLLESIMYNIIDIKSVDDKSMTVLVDPHKVRMGVGGGKKCNSAELDILVKELMAVVVDIKAKGFRVRGHLIDTIIDDNDAIKNKGSNIDGSDTFRSLWKVTIGAAYLEILKFDKIKIDRDPALVACLRSGISQAIVRLCSTHANTPNGGWILDGLIQDVGGIDVDDNGKYDSIKMRNRRREIKKDANGMIKCGIVLDGDRVFLDKSSNRRVATSPDKT